LLLKLFDFGCPNITPLLFVSQRKQFIKNIVYEVSNQQ